MALHSLQKWMQAVVTHPLGIEAGINSDAAQAVAAVSVEDIESVIGRSNSLGSVERLAVYGNAYFARLLECLGQEFPAVKQVLGEDAFNSIGLQYLQACPSRSYTLNELGRSFPDFLRETRPKDVPAPDWPDLLIDLATLERTYSEVFDGVGIEPLDAPAADSSAWSKLLALGFVPLIPSELAAIAAHDMGAIQLQAAPCLRLLKLDFPAHEFISALRRSETTDIAPPHAQSTLLVVSRRDFIVRRSVVSEFEFAVLQALLSGQSLSAALQTGAASANDDMPSDTVIGECFQRWVQARWFIGWKLPAKS